MEAFLIRDLLAAGCDPLTHEPPGNNPGRNRRTLFAYLRRPLRAPASSRILEPSLGNRSPLAPGAAQ
jgi:hypothetical protein